MHAINTSVWGIPACLFSPFSPLETISTPSWASLYHRFPILSVFSRVSCQLICIHIFSVVVGPSPSIGRPFFSFPVRPCPSFFMRVCLLLFSWYVHNNLITLRGRRPSRLERWIGLATGWSWPDLNPATATLLRNFGDSVYPTLPVSFGGDNKSRRSFLFGQGT